jgi:hypothetical protein
MIYDNVKRHEIETPIQGGLVPDQQNLTQRPEADLPPAARVSAGPLRVHFHIASHPRSEQIRDTKGAATYIIAT